MGIWGKGQVTMKTEMQIKENWCSVFYFLAWLGNWQLKKEKKSIPLAHIYSQPTFIYIYIYLPTSQNEDSSAEPAGPALRRPVRSLEINFFPCDAVNVPIFTQDSKYKT